MLESTMPTTNSQKKTIKGNDNNIERFYGIAHKMLLRDECYFHIKNNPIIKITVG